MVLFSWPALRLESEGCMWGGGLAGGPLEYDSLTITSFHYLGPKKRRSRLGDREEAWGLGGPRDGARWIPGQASKTSWDL